MILHSVVPINAVVVVPEISLTDRNTGTVFKPYANSVFLIVYNSYVTPFTNKLCTPYPNLNTLGNPEFDCGGFAGN